MLSDLLLGGDGEFIAGDEAAHLLQSEAQELLPLHHVCEMLLWETQTCSVTHNTTKHCTQQDEQVAGFQRFQFFFFFSSRLVKLLRKNHHHLAHHTTPHKHTVAKMSQDLWCELWEAYQRMRGPGWEAVCMCAGPQRLWSPDSWWGEAGTAGTRNKPDGHPSAGGDSLPGEEPVEMAHKAN